MKGRNQQQNCEAGTLQCGERGAETKQTNEGKTNIRDGGTGTSHTVLVMILQRRKEEKRTGEEHSSFVQLSLSLWVEAVECDSLQSCTVLLHY